MKSTSQSLALPPLRRVSAALLAMTAASHAELLVGESFHNYNTGPLHQQAVTGHGLTGNWTGAQISGGTATNHIQYQSSGLSMTGVYSSGGSAFINTGGNFAHRLTAAFESPLPSAGLLYGCYLFTTTVHENARTVGALAVGGADNNNDGNATFVWAGNAYNSSGSPAAESPGIRAQDTNTWSTPGLALTENETYIMLFEFNAGNGTTTAWVLNQAQLDYFMLLGLMTFDLKAASVGTGEANVLWTGTATAATEVGPVAYLHLFGFQSANPTFTFTWDEFRVSDTELVQAVTEAPPLPPLSPYQAWRNSYPELAGPEGESGEDYDQDGIVNLLEFVLGGNPTASDSSILPQGRIDGDDHLFTFTRTAASQTGATLNFQWGTNLETWTDVPIGTDDSGPHDGGATVTVDGEDIEVRVPRANATDGKLFGRLNATEP